MWIPILSAIAGAVFGQLIRYGFHRYQNKQQAVTEWNEDAITQISRGHGVCESARDRSDLNYGSISNEAAKTAQKLKALVNPYPDGVDDEAAEQVRALYVVFRKLAALTEASEEKATDEALDEIFEMGQQEYSQADNLDMGDAVNESTEYSPLMDKLFKKSDTDARIFGSQFGEQIEEVQTLEEMIQQMAPQVTDDQELIAKAVESQFISDEWEDGLSLGVRIYLQIAANLSTEAINYISEMNNMETVA
ncbi:hypothetical protein NDI56_20895 [Haloarcula sp. S1CR25-12]|uniref:Co-chaperone DjlA N-terminal domain-containing protein n=1 Tax=Haloarcula saliterrae TaxID=2950534 RepID=A0ABU2FI03_9EURY|nr:hypothetical protein [Haloarcula sp. S1CR25-12]MDS0261866.1 hypothetical protein [Haloarcula sp. S1CR25-12]